MKGVTMDNSYTAMLLVIDRSGSMASIRAEMEESLQALLAEQAKEPGLTTVDVATFDTAYELTHRMADPSKVKIEIKPRGGTALWDALRFCIEGFTQELAALPEHARPNKTIMVVATDGEENSSVQTKLATVKEMIESKQEHEQWEMVFLGANQDAVVEGTNLGFRADSSMTFDPTTDSVASMAAATSRFVSDVRRGSRKGFTNSEREASSPPRS
jgi:Mg-chelatase subunit ChlD